MTLKDFLHTYTDNLYQAITDNELSLDKAVQCCCCPLQDLCHADASSCDCADFIRKYTENELA